MEIYLDNCATTKPRKEVVEEMILYLREDYGNPSSLHRKGFSIEKEVEKSRALIADFLEVDRDEIYFTSGGTESNNIAIQGILNKAKKGHIITTKVEHSSVYNIIKHYEKKGFEVSYLDIDSKGLISLDDLEEAIREDTVLVSIMQVNNEIGSIQPTWGIRERLDRKNSKALIHLDGIQAMGKIPLNLREWGIDSFSISGHKIYGPKGIGALYLRKGLKLDPIIFGGGQEEGLRSGTENVPGILGLAKAVEILNHNFKDEFEEALELKTFLVREINDHIEDVHINTPIGSESSPYVLNISFANVKAEIILHYLENKEIYISTGSACSKGSKRSRTLEGLKLEERFREGAIRMCLAHDTTKEDLRVFVGELSKAVNEVREITMR